MSFAYPAKIRSTKEIVAESTERALVNLNDEIRTSLLAEVAMGKSLVTFCREYNLPQSTVRGWLYYDKKLEEAYRTAQEESHQARFDDIEDISEMALRDIKRFEGDRENQKFAQTLLNAYELKINTLKWKLSKLNPRRYSEKMDITSGGKALQGNTIIFAEFKKDSIPANVIDTEIIEQNNETSS